MPDAQTHFTMFGVVLLTGTLIALANARIYERCELARDLLKFGVTRDDVATWVCIAFHESRFDTAARNPHSGDHGLLQISELYWCGPGKACGVPCSAFRNEDIYDDVQCALRIHEEHTRLQGNGFLAWVVYPHHCKHNAKKYIIDCDTSVKHTPAKFDDRARHIKTFERNNTNPQFVGYPDIDKLKPPYLAINELFKGNYMNEFEKGYYNNKRPLNWLNFKIDNIDNLKLPDLTKKGYSERTTPSTDTLDPAIIGIKPPSPRKIESNQFRRRMMNSRTISTKNDDINDNEFRKTFGEVSPTNNVYVEIDLSQNPFIHLQKMSTKSSTEIPYPTRGLSTYNQNDMNNFASTTPRISTTLGSTMSSERRMSTEKNYSLHTTTPKTITSRRGKSRYVPENNNPDHSTLSSPSSTTSSPTVTRINKSDTAKVNINYNISMNSSNKSERRELELLETTSPATYTISNKSNKSMEIMENKATSSVDENSSIKTQQYENKPKTQTTNTSIEMSGSSTRFSWDSPRYIQTTVSTPQTIRTTTSRASAPTTPAPTTERVVPSSNVTPFVTQTTTDPTPTVRSTQSIFDLYLNPTKATLRPFKFSSFENSPFKVRIFSGGTTTPPASYLASRKLRR
nr:nuclear pore complex protein DDB_G0274915-like [Vanessa tameamea]